MSDIKNSLIKIAYENPELRGELLPVIMKVSSDSEQEEIEEPLFSHLGLPSDLGSYMTDSQIVNFWKKFENNPNDAALFQIGREFPPVVSGRTHYTTGYVQVDKDKQYKYHKPVFKITHIGLQPHVMVPFT
jgi:hypothetical protein